METADMVHDIFPIFVPEVDHMVATDIVPDMFPAVVPKAVPTNMVLVCAS